MRNYRIKKNSEVSTEMSVLEHLEEIRKRLIYCIIVFFISLVFGFSVSIPVIEQLKNDPIAKDIPWNVFAITDGLQVYLKASFIISFVFVVPFSMYQLWAFLKPGLTEKERKVSIVCIPFIILFIISGIFFSYYIVFPFILKFLGTITHMIGAEEMYGIKQYFDLLFKVVISICILFQLPVIVVFFTQIGLLTPDFLKRSRKISYVILTVLSALITPPDFVSQLIVLLPLILLFELSVTISTLVYKKKEGERPISQEKLKNKKLT